jgi:hypothetical protein
MKRLLAAVLLCAAAARAEDVKPVRVGASHRVDVIAPGEHVQTAIDRMRRATNPAKSIELRPADHLAPRGPSERAGERGSPSDGQRQGGPPPPQQAPGPGGGPLPAHR